MESHTPYGEPVQPGANTGDRLSPWWRIGTLLVIIIGFSVLVWIAAGTYKVGPPIPSRVVDRNGRTLFTRNDVMGGQQVFLKYGLMDNGTLWGHGAYIGPDFSAEYLHQLSVTAGESLARQVFGRPMTALTPAERGAVTGRVHDLLAENRYDAGSGVLTYVPVEASTYEVEVPRWRDYFSTTAPHRGLPPKYITDPEELRQLTAFFSWAAWATVAHVAGRNYSYTMEFPYEPLAGNGPTQGTVIWSALSLLSLLAGTALVLLAFGRFDYLGWRGQRKHIHPTILPGGATAPQLATLKFFVVVTLLFLAQTLIGGLLAHTTARPGAFYGLDIDSLLPAPLLRGWHLQLAIFWIATAFVGGGLFLASALGGRWSRWQVNTMNVLFAALVLVVAGSLVGELAGVKQLTGKLWYYIGDQGWEYLEIGRFWQWLLIGGLALWVVLLITLAGPVRRRSADREITTLFLLAAAAIPFFYLPAVFFTNMTRFTVVDTWRFWIIHLWVEGFFELFATVLVAVIFYRLGMVSRITATRVIYLDAILFLGSGIIGTGHHWYWTGQSNVSMALSAMFSAMEVVPLILLTLDAWPFVSLTRQTCSVCGKRIDLPHKWTFCFLISVGVWNFIGAGMFGLLVNLPVTSYFQAGTLLASNHGHGAMMGVFGMLAVGLVVFALRQASSAEDWARVEKYVKTSFWGLNIGLALMMLMNLFPTGMLQFADVVANGYRHARSAEFLGSPLIVFISRLRMPADLIVIFAGVVPLVIAALMVYRSAVMKTGKPT